MLDLRRLQSQLRRAVLARISSGQLSGRRLAHAIGYKQPHISNFLTGRRGLSVEGTDRILRVMGISVLDLIPRRLLEHFAISNYDPEYEAVPLVDTSALHLPQPPNSAIHERIKVNHSHLGRYRKDTTGRREGWVRFVWMRLQEADFAAMDPKIARGAILLVDRHYTSLLPHSAGEVDLYVVRVDNKTIVRWFEVHERKALLRANNPRAHTEFLPIDPKGRYVEKIIGRVCRVMYDVGGENGI